MIYLFYGEDKYRLQDKVNEILEMHRGDAGDINISIMDDKFDFNIIKNEGEALPFLSDKRLLVIKNILRSKDKTLTEKLSKWLLTLPDSTDLVFVEEDSPDQRTSFFKSISKIGKIEIFNELRPIETINWIKKRALEMGADIDPDAASLLQIFCGNDLQRLDTELSKLMAYDKHITKKTVEHLVDAGFFNTIFELTDALSEKKPKRSLDILIKLLDSGENEIYLLSMLARQVRNLLIIKDLSDHRLSESEIVNKTKLHPFVVKKTLGQAKNFTKNQLIDLHGKIVELDYAMKSTNTEPRVLLEKFVSEMTI